MSDTLIFLGNAPRAVRDCGDCGKTRACAPSVMKQNPEKFFFSIIEKCDRCGLNVEVDTSVLGTRSPEGCCEVCGTQHDLVRVELANPDQTIRWGQVCAGCLEDGGESDPEDVRHWQGDVQRAERVW